MSLREGNCATATVARAAAVVLGALALIGLLAGPAAAGKPKLTIPRASEKADRFAEKTCKRDDNCVGSGVLNCNRKGNLVVHCRIFDDRHTDAQGKYRCHREIRMVMNPDNNRVPVNGLGRWHCGGGGSPN